MSGLEILIAGVSAATGLMQAQATLAAGDAAKQQADYQAKQLEAQGKMEQAAAQAEGQELAQKRDLALSRQKTEAAASGFSATDPSTLAEADRIFRYGTLQQRRAEFGGLSRRANLDAQAAGRRIEGKLAKQASRTQAISTLAGAGTSVAKIYGRSSGLYSGGGKNDSDFLDDYYG